MVASRALLEQLSSLDDEERIDVAEALLSSVDDGDDLDDEERARLHAAIDRSEEDIKAKRYHSARDVIAELRARHAL